MVPVSPIPKAEETLRQILVVNAPGVPTANSNAMLEPERATPFVDG